MKRMLPYLLIIALAPGCKRNHLPVISDLACTPETRNAGTIFTLKATASDEDGDALTYLWKAVEGSFTTAENAREVKWKSPLTGAGKTCVIGVFVSDGENEVSRELSIPLGEPELGSIAGQVNFTNFRIPIPEVTIRVGDNMTTSDENGNFTLSGIPAIDDTLIAARQDFTTFKSALKIKVNDTLKVSIEITSVNFTTKLSGIVSDQDGAPQEYAQVVILNPDGSESKLKATTNASGYYRLWYIPHGDRTIIARKTSTDDFAFVELKQNVDFQEVETQMNLELQKLSLRGEFTDSRDNHIYRYRTIGNLTWMIDNLAYLPKVSPSANVSDKDAYCYVYGYQGTETSKAMATENFKLYGALYNLPAARVVCPVGWHLSTNEEWEVVIKASEPLAGNQMKSTSGWINHGNGTNASGFSGLPGGYVNNSGSFQGLGETALFNTSSFLSSESIFRGLLYDNDGVWLFGFDGKLGCSVRCVRNK